MLNMESFRPVCFEAEGSMELPEGKISYRTVSEDNVFYAEDGEAVGSLFSYSYFRTDVENAAERPVLFCFNGGPGASCMVLHAGMFGLKRVQYPQSTEAYPSLPPYEIVDNSECLLDLADIVMVDPAGTGYGVLLESSHKEELLGIDADAEALLTFIGRWLTKYHRWKSPKYLVGESYGCTRAATAAGIAATGGKKRSYNLTFDGLIFIGNTVSVNKYFNKGPYTEIPVEAFMTMAAINWYHRRPTDLPLEEFALEAQQFASTDYLLALYKGEALTGEERQKIKDQIRYYLGVSDEYLEAHDLRVERESFCRELLKDEHKVISILDGRFARESFRPLYKEGTKGYSCEAVSCRYSPFFLAALQDDIFPMLGIHDFDRAYLPSRSYGTELIPNPEWNFETDSLVSGERLHIAMTVVPGMRVMFANGWFDLCTQTGLVFHTASHCNLPGDRVLIRHYPSGHMAYIGEENVKALSADIRTFIGQKKEK